MFVVNILNQRLGDRHEACTCRKLVLLLPVRVCVVITYIGGQEEGEGGRESKRERETGVRWTG